MRTRFAEAAVVIVAFIYAVVGPALAQPSLAPSEVNPIVAENRLAGSDEWRLNRSGFKVASDAGGEIKSYASQASVNIGGTLELHVSVAPAQTYTVQVFRIGWYAGKGGRLVASMGPLPGTTQATCPIDGATGLRACRWTPSVTLHIPRNWTPGIYLALLTNAQNYQNYVPFVVRDDSRTGAFVYKQPINTYQAYNNYPNDHVTGKSLYDHNSFGPSTVPGRSGAVKVSFDRPYADNGAGQFLEWEYSLVRWLERSGYDMTYVTDLDVDANPRALLGAKGVISAGHDEYWSKPMFDGMLAARDSGENLAFMGADAGDWQVRYEASPTGQPNRVLVGYKDAQVDPQPDSALKTVWWRDPPLNRAPQSLIGVQWQYLLNANTDFVVDHADSWVYANTGFRDGDVVPGIVGYEVDSAMPNYAFPRAREGTYSLLSASPVVDTYGHPGVSNASVYQASNGAWVFASGTMSWSWGLEPERSYDPRIQQASANVLDTFLTGELPAPAPTPRLTHYGTAVMGDAPLAYWPLTDASGAIVEDVSGHHRAGLRLGGLTVQDGATTSDGTGSVFLPHLPAVLDFTIEGWAHLQDANWNASAFWDNTLYGAEGKVRLLLRPGSPTANNSHGYFGVWLNGTEYALQPLHDNTDNTRVWVHWALVRSAERLSVYRNGIKVAERSDLPDDAPANVSGQLFAQGNALRFKGALRDVAIYDHALKDVQLQDHFLASTAG